MVTCGSSIKLRHDVTGYRLHSHEISWGSGSGQQSVTAVNSDSDTNSLWTIYGQLGQCPSSTPVSCGDVIRLKHGRTGNFLHSHNHRSPLSKQQEVSCYPDGQTDSGDYWVVECVEKTNYWMRSDAVVLRHLDTSTYLTTARTYVFNDRNCGRNCPIAQQLEVSAKTKTTRDTKWVAAEGFFFPVPDDFDFDSL